MTILDHLAFSNSFLELPGHFYSKVQPEPLQNPKMVSISPQAASLIDLQMDSLNKQALLDLVSGKSLPPNGASIATKYTGHQFGGYNPDLGDGRALLIGEVTNKLGEKWELQLKGSGKTPYSRFGDGRAVLRSTIREYLCSEAMHGLGIPTTRALALCTSDTVVEREILEQGASLIRMAPSLIRFGHFEYLFYTQQHEDIPVLADYVIRHHFPELENHPDKYAEWLKIIIQRTASMIADWQTVGFSHGVMNTDNMSILGLTIDYGPYGFMDDFNPGFICNHSDHAGRYAYNQQVNIGLWNLNALAHALSPLIEIEQLREALSLYEPAFLESFRATMRNKLGLLQNIEGEDELFGDLLMLLAKEQRDYTSFFRQLSHNIDNTGEMRDFFIDREAYDQWNTRYQAFLSQDCKTAEDTKALMLANNPKYILRNYLAQQAIEKAEAGDFTMVEDLLKALSNPFEEQDEFANFAEPPPDWGKKLEVSCSS